MYVYIMKIYKNYIFSSFMSLTYFARCQENTHCEINTFIWKRNSIKSDTHTYVLFSWILTLEKQQQNVTSWRRIVHCWVPSPDTNSKHQYLTTWKWDTTINRLSPGGKKLLLFTQDGISWESVLYHWSFHVH